MYVNAHLRVLINGNLIKNISSVETTNDSAHLGSTCEITMPLNARIKYTSDKLDENGQATGFVETLTELPINVFSTGDQITVLAKYDGYENATGNQDGWLPIFEGYLYDFYQGSPLKIKCLDSIYLANKGTFTRDYKKISLKQLIKDVIAGTDLSIIDVEKTYTDANGNQVQNTLCDLDLENITFKDMSPAAVMEWLRKELGINISLQGKKVYYNIASNTLNTVKFSTGVNVMKSNLETTNLNNIKNKTTGISETTTQNVSIFQKFQVKAWFLQPDGTKDSIEVGDEGGQLREVFFYKVPRKASDALTIANYKELATQALIKVRQSRFNGIIETYLYPYCDLFWRVIYDDKSYPNRNGTYVITQMTVKINQSGYHRSIKLAYLGDIV